MAIVLILGSAFLVLKLGKKNSGQDAIISEVEHLEEQPEEAEHEYVFAGDWMDGRDVLVYGRPLPLKYI